MGSRSDFSLQTICSGPSSIFPWGRRWSFSGIPLLENEVIDAQGAVAKGWLVILCFQLFWKHKLYFLATLGKNEADSLIRKCLEISGKVPCALRWLQGCLSGALGAPRERGLDDK